MVLVHRIEMNIYSRFVGFHFLIALVNLYLDFESLAGEAGLIPCVSTLRESIASEFSVFNRFLYFPSLLYFVPPWVLLVVGFGVAVKSIYRPQRLDFALMYLIYLSFSPCRGVMLWFPWDCLLYELLIQHALLPNSHFLPAFTLFRVVFGFGKHKFLGSSLFTGDLLYLKSMACWQPLASNIGRIASVLAPDVFHAVGIFFTFFVECISCWALVFWPKRVELRKAACLAIIALMTGIQLFGHFGWFNTLTSLLAWRVGWGGEANKPPEPSRGPGVLGRALYIMVSIVFIIPSQWSSPSVFYENQFPLGAVFRVLSSWRVLHSYGVFPPKTLPMLKPVGRFEFSCDDGEHWTLDYKYQHSRSREGGDLPPFLLAPWRFPRFDYVVAFYGSSHVFSLVSGLGPGWGSGEEWHEAVARKIFEGDVKPYFQESSICKDVQEVRLLMVSVRPTEDGSGWEQVTEDVDKVWKREDLKITDKSFVFHLPPAMVALRLLSNDRADGNTSCLALWHEAHSAVDWDVCRSTTSEFTALQLAYKELVQQKKTTCDDIPLPGWEHARRWAGSMGCFTAFHLIPPFLHPALCKSLVRQNLEDGRFPYTRLDPPVWMQNLFRH